MWSTGRGQALLLFLLLLITATTTDIATTSGYGLETGVRVDGCI